MTKLIKTEYVPDYVSAPGETLQEKLDELGFSQAELAMRTGRPKKTINEIIQGKAAITPETAIQFEMVLKIPAHFWLTREAKYRSWLAQKSEDNRLENEIEILSRLPIRHMIDYGWIASRSSKVDQLKEVLSFFGVASSNQIQCIEQIAFRKSRSYKSDPWSLAAWLRKGEIDAREMNFPEYNSDRFLQSLSEIRLMTLEEPKTFVPKLVQKCGDAGVYVVFTRELPKTCISGATRWLNSLRPLLQMSLRHKDDGHVWFTFFHEAGHIYLGHAKKDIFLEDEHRGSLDAIDQFENAANDFANNILIPERLLERFMEQEDFSDKAIENFSTKIRVAAGIVVGRLQNMSKLRYDQGHRLKKKYCWENWPMSVFKA